MPRRDGKKTTAAKHAAASKIVKKQVARAKSMGPIKAGKTKEGIPGVVEGRGGIRNKAGAKYAPGKGPVNHAGGPASTTPKYGQKIDHRKITPIKEKAKQYEAKERFEAHKRKLAGKQLPSLGIKSRPSTTGTGRQRTTSYRGMRPGPLKD